MKSGARAAAYGTAIGVTVGIGLGLESSTMTVLGLALALPSSLISGPINYLLLPTSWPPALRVIAAAAVYGLGGTAQWAIGEWIVGTFRRTT